MTHNDIKTKFMIEYDKANVTSSYPSLTEYEVATILDKAYNALIAQKVTGNNPRRAPFEADTKSVSDLQGLVITDEDMPLEPSENVQNVTYCLFEDLEETDGFLYFVGGTVKYYPAYEDIKSYNKSNKQFTIPVSDLKNFEQYDNTSSFRFTYKNSQQEDDEHLLYSLIKDESVPLSRDTDMPFTIQKSVLESDDYASILILKSISVVGSDDPNGNKMYVLAIIHDTLNPYDDNVDRNDQITLVSHDMAKKSFVTSYNMPWVKAPLCYIEDNKFFIVSDPIKRAPSYLSLTYIKKPTSFINSNGNTTFELNDTIAEELISLAITFALENVESPRLNSHVQLNALES